MNALRVGLFLHELEALLNGVLVRAAEGRVDQIAAVWAAFVHRQLIAVFDGALYLV